MSKERTVHTWHLLSLFLALVAGAALWGHVRDFLPGVPTEPMPPSAQAGVAFNDTELNPSSAQSPNPASGEMDAGAASATESVSLFFQNDIDDLREELSIAREEIDELREEVIELTSAVNVGILEEADKANRSDNPSGFAEEVVSGRTAARARNFPSIADEQNALRQAGVSQERMEAIQRQQDQRSLARLELFDRAEREGWSNTERLGEELETLDETSTSLREELGDAAYDQYLFNLGQANRILVESVIAGSTADLAGMRAGDMIISYAARRVFSLRELRAATREGVRNEPIVMEIVRDQQPMTMDVVRGPLGITMTATSIAP